MMKTKPVDKFNNVARVRLILRNVRRRTGITGKVMRIMQIWTALDYRPV